MSPRLPPQLYVVTDRHATAGRPLGEAVRHVLEALAGTQLRVAVQLREKTLCTRAVFTEAERLRGITADYDAGLFINDRVDVACAVAADGVHLGRGALPVAAVKDIDQRLMVGLSTHDLAEVRAAAAAGADFAVFGPVFDTPSKRGLLPPRGLAALAQASALGLPLLALGGIDERTALPCLTAGAAGLAAIRWFLHEESLPEEFVATLTKHFVHDAKGSYRSSNEPPSVT